MSETLVTSSASLGVGTLASVVANAVSGDVVRFSQSVFERGTAIEIALASTLEIDKNLTLEGGPFRVRLTAPSGARLFKIADGANVVLTGFDLVGGVATGASGGGVLVESQANATINRCRIVGCNASHNGGGIYVGDAATATVCDSALYGNRATFDGGGIYVAQNASLALRGATVVANASGVDGADVFCADDFRSATAINSIVEVADRADSEALFIDETNVGNVVGVPRLNVGFVATPGVSSFYDSWTSTAWESWDFHLLDDASETPSTYRDAGALDADLTKYDLDGNFRGRVSANGIGETVETRSPGAYETIQADLFWIGKDSTGNAVASPSWNAADGWATSRFATVSGAAAPSGNISFFIGKNVAFVDYPTTTTKYGKVVLGGGTVASTPARTGTDPAQALKTAAYFSGVGAFLDGAATASNKYRFSVAGDVFLGAYSSLGACVSYSDSAQSNKKLEADVGTNIYCAITGYVTLPSEPFYNTISLYRQTRPLSEGVLRCDLFMATAADAFNPGFGVVYAKSFMSTTAAGTANAPLIVYFESTGNAANAGKSDPNVSFVLLNGANATLNLNGHKVSGVGGTVGITGSATVDETLTCSALTLNANAILGLNGYLGAATATLNAGSKFVGTGTFVFDLDGTAFFDSTFTVNDVAIADYNETTNALQIAVDASALVWDSRPNDAQKACLSASFLETPGLVFRLSKYVLGDEGSVGAYREIYVTNAPTFDSSADVYETTAEWNGTTRKTLVDNTSELGWNYYRVDLDAPLYKGGVALSTYRSARRRVAVPIGSDAATRVYYYRGGATGSFADASDWALSADGVAEFDGAPIFAGSVVDFPTSAVVSEYPTAAAPTRIDVEFPNEIEILDGCGTQIDGNLPLVSTRVPAPTGAEFYVGNGGTSALWTPTPGATRYEIESVETTPQTFETSDATWRDDTQMSAKSWRVRIKAPIYGNVESWSTPLLAARPLTSLAETESESESNGNRSFAVAYASGYPDENFATIKRRRADSAADAWEIVDSEFNGTEFSDLPPTVDEYFYRVEWNRASNVWVETKAARWDVALFSWISETTFPTSQNLASETPTFAARIERKKSGELLRREEVAAIRFSLFEKKTFGAKSFERLAVDERGKPLFQDVPISPATFRNSLLTDAAFWTRDAVGCHFVFTPETSARPFFPTSGDYVVRVAFDVLPLGESPSKTRTFFVDFNVAAK